MSVETSTHYYCTCEECYWGTIVDSTTAAADEVREHEAKTGHAWVVKGLNQDEGVAEE